MANDDVKEATEKGMEVEGNEAKVGKTEKKNGEKKGSTAGRRSTRKRKTIERLETSRPEKEQRVYIPGEGVKLGDIEKIKDAIGISSTDELQIVHKILYGKVGKKFSRKKGIRDFSGVQEDEVPEVEKRLKRLKQKDLKICMRIFGLKTVGNSVRCLKP